MTDGSAGSSPTSAQLPDWPLRRPASRRISNPVSMRLQTITEGNANTPPVPPRSSMRDSGSSWSLPRNDALQPPSPRDGRRSTDRPGTAPPAYEWMPDPNPSDADIDGRQPIEGEKLAALRRGGGYIRQSRGGLLRLALLIGVLLVIVVGLAVGLGVGLTVGRHHSSGSSHSGQPSTTNSSTALNQSFPLGNYSMIAALQTQNTSCTSNAATWVCPTIILGSGYSFNLNIAPTDANYATIHSGSTPDAGIPANLTISSIGLFSLQFVNKTLTYVSSSANASSARYTFSFTQEKKVDPSAVLTSDGSGAVCYYNQTTVAGALYLAAQRDYPSGSNANSTILGGYQQWPYAFELTQTNAGGDDVPDCRESSNSSPITTGLVPQSSTQECECGYRNYF